MNKILIILAAFLLLFNGVGALYGGWNLIAHPDGSSIDLSMSWLKHTPFQNYRIPGIILFIANGLCSIFVLTTLLLKFKRISMVRNGSRCNTLRMDCNTDSADPNNLFPSHHFRIRWCCPHHHWMGTQAIQSVTHPGSFISKVVSLIQRHFTGTHTDCPIAILVVYYCGIHCSTCKSHTAMITR